VISEPLVPVSVRDSGRILTFWNIVAALLVLGILVFFAEASRGVGQTLAELRAAPVSGLGLGDLARHDEPTDRVLDQGQLSIGEAGQERRCGQDRACPMQTTPRATALFTEISGA
jgi:hypothetical protein